MIHIARDRGITILKTLQSDLSTNNLLFEGQSQSKPDKHKFVTKVEDLVIRNLKKLRNSKSLEIKKWL